MLLSRSLLGTAFLLSTALMAPALRAQSPKAQTTAPTGNTITVHGMSEDEVRRSVEQLTATPWYEQLSRWQSPVCPIVFGLPARYEKVVLTHVQRAIASIQHTKPHDCDTHNVYIAFSQNGTTLFNEIYRQRPSLGQGANSIGIGMSDKRLPGPTVVKELRKDRPVRWYRGVVTDPAPGNMPSLLPGTQGRTMLTNIGSGPTLLGKNTVMHASSLIIIVDLPLSAGATWGQLGDYIAFVTLASPGMDTTSFSSTSIMSLYNGGHFQSSAPTALTAFDTAMLSSLYNALDAQNAHDEQAEIAHDVVQVLAQQDRAKTESP